jgi:hypothetical protein
MHLDHGFPILPKDKNDLGPLLKTDSQTLPHTYQIQIAEKDRINNTIENDIR